MAAPFQRMTAAAVTPAPTIAPTADAAAVTAPAIAPPMATLWTAENRLPATTLPIPACIPAATEPSYSNELDVTHHYRLLDERTLPATGSATPKPQAIAPRPAETKMGDTTTPTVALATTATDFKTKCEKDVETIIG